MMSETVADHASLRNLQTAVFHNPKDLAMRVEYGFALLAQGSWMASRAIFMNVLRQDQWSFAAALGVAKAARGANNRLAALAYARQAAAIDPGEAGVQLDIAFDLLHFERWDEAETVFRKLVEKNSIERGIHAGALIGLGHLARKRGARAEALALFHEALALQPDHIEAMLEAASELLACGQGNDAVPLVEAALQREPTHLNALMLRAHLAQAADDLDHAGHCFAAAGSAHPSFLSAWVGLAGVRRLQGKPDAALALLHHVLKQDKDDLEALLGLADIAWLAQDHARCLALSLQAGRAHPASIAPPLQATRALMEMGQTAEALALLEPFGDAHRCPPGIRARKAEILQASGRWRAAEIVLSTANEPEDFGLWVQRIQLRMTLGHFVDATALLSSAPARSTSEHGLVGLFRGQIAEAQWQLGEARDRYRRAIDGNPNAAWVHAELARVSLLLCDIDGCRAHTMAALQRDAAVHLLRGQSLNPASTHVGQILDEFRMDPVRTLDLARLVALPPEARLEPLVAMQREAPDHLPTAMQLAIALRQAGRLDHRPEPVACDGIPRRIVQYWDEAAPPAEIAAMMEGWATRHPDFDYCRFDLASAGCYLRDHHPAGLVRAFVRASYPAQKADIFRLAYLAREGGVYVDADDRCLGHLGVLLPPDASFVAWQEHFGTLGNNLLAAAPGSPVLLRAASLAADAVNRGDEDIPWLATGPGLLTRAWAQILAEAADLESALHGCYVLTQAQTAQVALFHQFAAYKRTSKHWLRAAFGATEPEEVA